MKRLSVKTIQFFIFLLLSIAIPSGIYAVALPSPTTTVASQPESAIVQLGNTQVLISKHSATTKQATKKSIVKLKHKPKNKAKKQAEPKVIQLGKTQTTTVTQKKARKSIIKKPVIELKSKSISKNEMLKFLKNHKKKLAISYAVLRPDHVDASALSSSLSYYLNQNTNKIGVAYNPAAAKAMTTNPSTVFSAKEGETLKTTLTRWAKKAGYQLQWLSAYDYRLEYSYEFVGSLTAQNGPLNQALTSISNNNYVLKAVVCANKVILIKDNDYSPSILSR